MDADRLGLLVDRQDDFARCLTGIGVDPGTMRHDARVTRQQVACRPGHLIEDLDLRFAARQQPKIYLIPNTAGDPSVFRHPRDRGKAHLSRTADHLQDRRNRLDAVD